MMWIWVLTYTILGTTPEHGSIAKFQTRQECEQRLQEMRTDAKLERKQIVGSCTLVLR